MPFLKHTSAALGFGLLLATSTASAQTQPQKGFVLDRFDPSERGSEWFVLDSLDLRGHVRPAAGVVGSWAYDTLVVRDRDGNYVSSLVEHQVFVHPGASLVLWNRVRAGFSLPIAVYQTGDPIAINGKSYSPPESAVGDLRLAADVRLFGKHGGPITGALGAGLYLPTGSRDNYTSDGNVRVLPRATVAGDIALFTYSARLGFHYRPLSEQFERNPLGSEVTFAAAAGVRVADRKLVIGPEIYGSSIVDSDSFFKRRGTPVEALLGAHVTVSDFRFGGGLGTGLSRGWGTPTLRAFLSAEWAPGWTDDTDRDGIPDTEDACPKARGVRTSDPKTNGCPPKAVPLAPADRDGDGIVDSADACPDIAGLKSSEPKKNGCPPDRDSDGVYDLVDACPDVAGPKSEDPKKNGCPPDRDSDGIADDRDACPDVAGARSEDPLLNGCPPDRDSDGVYDAEDACPDAPGAADPDPKRNGCPLARIEGGQIKIVEQVKFKFASAEIVRDSDPTLLAVATTLKAHPEITKIRVEGHTDNMGRRDANTKLSQLRAEAVVKWLTSYGIAKSRFEAKGFGMNHPIDTNATEEGRQNNRRVEFHIAGTDKSAAPSEPAPKP
ncbi:MAG: Outer rane lipoprotein omp16 precursor [Labilithrix sp.]|nr:Outer rane lipoprotein omp16 precursor [Labilithrix sp.]